MALDITKLEKVKQRENLTIARCPACAEDGGDNKGEHLCIYEDGRFGCVIYPGALGELHRRRIFKLVGLKKAIPKTFTVHKAERNKEPP